MDKFWVWRIGISLPETSVENAWDLLQSAAFQGRNFNCFFPVAFASISGVHVGKEARDSAKELRNNYIFPQRRTGVVDAGINKLLRTPGEKTNGLALVQRQRHSSSPVFHLEKGMNTRSKECSTPCKKREPPPSIAAQLPDIKKAHSYFPFFPWHLPEICLFFRFSHPNWAHFYTKAGIAVWTRAGKEKSWELSRHLSWAPDWVSLEQAPSHIRCSSSQFLQHALSLEWQRQHTVYYRIPFCWWQTYPGILFRALNSAFL